MPIPLVMAQTEAESPSTDISTPEVIAVSDNINAPSFIEDMTTRAKIRDDKNELLPDFSLLFTQGELDLLKDAEKGLVARPATETEIKQSEEQTINQAPPPQKGPRNITLGGIIYRASNDWVVWINGEKITPKNLPKAILDIRVYKDKVRLKWFDEYTNQVFPIKMRAHQRFNIDSRIFLPG